MPIAIVKLSDIGQYTAGRLSASTSSHTTISPGKTWERRAGGLLFAVLAAFIVRPDFFAGGELIAALNARWILIAALRDCHRHRRHARRPGRVDAQARRRRERLQHLAARLRRRARPAGLAAWARPDRLSVLGDAWSGPDAAEPTRLRQLCTVAAVLPVTDLYIWRNLLASRVATQAGQPLLVRFQGLGIVDSW